MSRGKVGANPVCSHEFCLTTHRRDRPVGAEHYFGMGIAVLLPLLAALFAMIAGIWPIAAGGILVAVLVGSLMFMFGLESRDYERIRIQGDRFWVERRTFGKGTSAEFNRSWVQLVVGAAPAPQNPHLWVRSHGRQIEIGTLMSAADRRALGQEIRTRVGTAYGNLGGWNEGRND